MPRISFVLILLFVVRVNMTPINDQNRNEDVEFEDINLVSPLVVLIRWFNEEPIFQPTDIA